MHSKPDRVVSENSPGCLRRQEKSGGGHTCGPHGLGSNILTQISETDLGILSTYKRCESGCPVISGGEWICSISSLGTVRSPSSSSSSLGSEVRINPTRNESMELTSDDRTPNTTAVFCVVSYNITDGGPIT